MKQLLYFASCIVCVFVLFTNAQAQSDILPAHTFPGRKSPVIQGELYIRLSPKAIDGRDFLPIATAIPGIQVIEQLLPPERTLLYNPRQNTRNKKRNNNLQAIYAAEYSLVRSFKIRFTEQVPPEQMATILLQKYSQIEIAEPVYVHEVLTLPNDSRRDEAIQLPPMQAFEAWEVYQGDSTIVIGISDSGTEQTHEDLQSSLWINEGEIPDNGIDDDENGYIDDYNGYNFAWREDEVTPGNTSKVANTSVGNHGTGAAGLAAATPDNGVGILGSGFRSKLFPLKTVEFGGNFIRYGSNSIIYAGEMELDVLNCSWGSQNFSEIVRSATEYAIARGVVITAGAGNNNLPVIFYPAAYKGVLGVGNTNTAGELARSNYGYSAKILASSEFAITTWSQNAYGGFCCTSGASALTSGIVALARGRFPELSPEQIIAYLRQCTDDMSAYNAGVKEYLAGRANMLKVVSFNPDTIPGLVLDSFDILTPAGTAIQNRVLPGDTVRLRFTVKNVLASVGALQWQLDVLGNNPAPALTFLTTEAVTDTLASGDTVQLTDFLVRIERFSETQVFFRLQANSTSGYKEFFLTPFVPTEEFITLQNDSLVISIGDKAQIGYSGFFGARRGEGMYLKSAESKHSLLYEGGMFMVMKNEGGTTVISSATRPESLELPPVNDFSVQKRLASNDLTSELESDNLQAAGMQLRIAVDALAANATAVSMPISVVRNNLSATPPDTLAMGYFFDFEASADGNDRAMLYSPRFVDTTKVRAAFAMIRPATDTVTGSFCIVGVFSLLPNAGEPQLCIINNDNDIAETPFGTYDGFTAEEKERSLSAGTTLRYSGDGDIGVIAGMRFAQHFTGSQPENEANMVLVLGAGHDSVAAESALAQALAPYGVVSVADAPIIAQNLWKVHPTPAKTECRMYAPEHVNGMVKTTLYSLNGKTLATKNILFANGISEQIPLAGISHGQYFIAVEQQGTTIILPVLIRE